MPNIERVRLFFKNEKNMAKNAKLIVYGFQSIQAKVKYSVLFWKIKLKKLILVKSRWKLLSCLLLLNSEGRYPEGSTQN